MKLRENFTFINFGKSEVFESGHVVIPIKPVVLFPDRLLCFLLSLGYNDDDEIDTTTIQPTTNNGLFTSTIPPTNHHAANLLYSTTNQPTRNN